MSSVVPPKIQLEKKLNKFAWVVSACVFILVVSMRRIHIDTDIDFTWLPSFYSTLNGIVALVLIAALYAIKRNNAMVHRKLMTTAMLLSGLFLLSYVIYHFTTPETTFCGVGSIRIFYFFLLITHIILAAAILPFILFTYIRAYTHQFEKHVKLARWVFPLWLYVAVTGPVLFLLLSPCYAH
ncbi:MAG: putative membrane protein [Saprospiraceae bacterium]|jgi:putative membrane protein